MPANSPNWLKVETELTALGLPQAFVEAENDSGKKHSVATTKAPTAKSFAAALEDWFRGCNDIFSKGGVQMSEAEKDDHLKEIAKKAFGHKHGGVKVDEAQKDDYLKEIAKKASEPPVVGERGGAAKPPPVCGVNASLAFRALIKKHRLGQTIFNDDIKRIEAGLLEMANVGKPRAVRLLAAVLAAVVDPVAALDHLANFGVTDPKAISASRPTGTDKKEYGPIYDEVLACVTNAKFEVSAALQDADHQTLAGLQADQYRMKRQIVRQPADSRFLKIMLAKHEGGYMPREQVEAVYEQLRKSLLRDVKELSKSLLVRNEDFEGFEAGCMYVELNDCTDAGVVLMNWPEYGFDGQISSVEAMPSEIAGVNPTDLLA